MTNWSGSFLVTLTVDPLSKALTYMGLFWLYAGVSLGGAGILARNLPETKGKSLEQITKLFTREGEEVDPFDLLSEEDQEKVVLQRPD